MTIKLSDYVFRFVAATGVRHVFEVTGGRQPVFQAACPIRVNELGRLPLGRDPVTGLHQLRRDTPEVIAVPRPVIMLGGQPHPPPMVHVVTLSGEGIWLTWVGRVEHAIL